MPPAILANGIWGEKITIRPSRDDQSAVFGGFRYIDIGETLFPPQEIPEDQYLAEALTDLSLEFIGQNKQHPFFLFLSHFDVHVPLDADSATIQKYLNKPKVEGYPGNAIYAGMIEAIDSWSGFAAAPGF